MTNTLGERASDRIHLRLLSIPSGHPRFYLTASKLAMLRSQAVATNAPYRTLVL